MSTMKLAQACVNCNRKKIKCDFSSGETSCQTCKDQSIECIRRTRKRPRQSDQHLLERQEYEQRNGQSRSLSVGSQNVSEITHQPLRGPGQTQSPGMPGLQNLNPGTYREPLGYNFGPSDVEPQPQTQPVDSHTANVEETTHDAPSTFIGRAHYLSHDTQFDEATARAYPSYQSDELSGLGESVLSIFRAFDLPARSMKQGLTDAFVRFCYPWTPILSRGDVESPPEKTSLLLSQSMFLAASRASSSPGVLAFATPAQFYQRAKALFFMNHEKNPMAVIKATIMLQWYTPDGPEHVSYDASEFWLKIGVGVAYQIGLHRDPGTSQNASERRRVWWSLVVRDALMSVAHGRPRAISPEDNNVRFLCSSDFDDSLVGGGELFVHYATICCILGDITEACSRNTLTQAKTIQIQNSLFRWSRTLPPSLHIAHGKPNSDECLLSAYDLNTRQLHIPYFVGLAIIGRSNTKTSISAQSIIAASFVAGLFEELLVRDDISHLAPIFTRYCIAASCFLISLRPFPRLWEACQSDLRILRLSLQELSKRWKSALGGSKALESILNTQQNHATNSPRRTPWLTRDQQSFFDGYSLELCQVWKPYSQFCEQAEKGLEMESQFLAAESNGQAIFIPPNDTFTGDITDTAALVADPGAEFPDLSLADLLCEGMENWF